MDSEHLPNPCHNYLPYLFLLSLFCRMLPACCSCLLSVSQDRASFRTESPSVFSYTFKHLRPEMSSGDLFDGVLSLEDEFTEGGWQDGLKAGEKSGFVEGFALGCDKGFDIGREIGFYRGCCQVWRTTTTTGKDDPKEETTLGKGTGSQRSALWIFPPFHPDSIGLHSSSLSLSFSL